MSCTDGECTCKGNKHAKAESLMLLSGGHKASTESSDFLNNAFSQVQRLESVAEIRFKNGRTGHFRNKRFLDIEKDQRLVVEVNTGWDLGTVHRIYSNGDLLGDLNIDKPEALPSILRIASTDDLNRWLAIRKQDKELLSDCRTLVKKNGLNFFIRDVEISTDGKCMRVYSTGNESDVNTIHTLLGEKYQTLFNSIVVIPH